MIYFKSRLTVSGTFMSVFALPAMSRDFLSDKIRVM